MRGYLSGKPVRVDGELVTIKDAGLKALGEYAAACALQDYILDAARPGKYDDDTAFALAAAVLSELKPAVQKLLPDMITECEANGCFLPANDNPNTEAQPVPLPDGKYSFFIEALADIIAKHLPFTDNGFGEHVMSIELSSGRSLEVRPVTARQKPGDSIPPKGGEEHGNTQPYSLSWVLFCSEEDQERYPETGGIIGEMVTDARVPQASVTAMEWAWRLAETWDGPA